MNINNVTLHIIFAVMTPLVLMTSCQETPTQEPSGQVLAAVAEERLYTEEVAAKIPSGLSQTDSIAFVKAYAKRWIERQVKLREAKRIFSSTVEDIDMMVEEYRQSLLTRRLDQYYIGTSQEAPYSEEEIERYYKENSANLKLDAPIVKGRLMRIPRNHASEKKLLEMMKSTTESSRQDLISTIEKVIDCVLEDFGATWVDYNEFMARLPIVRDNNYMSYMTRRGVQTLRTDDYTYYFDISEYSKTGDTAPLERAKGAIELILTNQRHKEIISDADSKLQLNAAAEGVIHNYTLGKE